jgi:hypothetical protein
MRSECFIIWNFALWQLLSNVKTQGGAVGSFRTYTQKHAEKLLPGLAPSHSFAYVWYSCSIATIICQNMNFVFYWVHTATDLLTGLN